MDASKLIDQKIATLNDWRAPRMKDVRRVIHEVVPDVVEEWKWMGSPVFNKDGILCVLNPHKETVRMTFPKGAKMKNQKPFNSELEGNARRAILWSEGDALDVAGLKSVLLEAVALNQKTPAARKTGAKGSVTGYLPSTKKAPAKKAPAKKAAAPKKTAAKKTAAKKTAKTKTR